MNWQNELHLSWENRQSWAEQLRDQLRAMIQSGRLQPGQRLPPVRQLAQALGIHFNTVARAYRLLSKEGWISLRHGRGAYVRQAPPDAWDEEALHALARRFVEQSAWLGFDASAIRAAVETALQARFPATDEAQRPHEEVRP